MLVLPCPIRALFLDKPLYVSGANYDPALLPWTDPEDGDFNSDSPPLGTAMLKPTFEPPELRLAAGVHLHFILPPALTNGIVPSRERGGSRYQFPPVPIRWQVRRRRRGKVDKNWVVESTRIVPDGQGVRYATHYRGGKPFVSIGLQYEEGNKPTGKAEYLAKYTPDPLTAVGWGDPNFAAYYPNCHSVFGACDPGGRLGDSYEVEGSWPNKTSTSAIRQDRSLQVYDATAGKAGKDRIDLAEYKNETLVCVGAITLDKRAEPVAAQTPKIVIGHTAAEALAAHVAKSDDILEHQLAATLVAPELDAKNIDHGPLYGEARHQDGFVASDGGTIFGIRRKQDVNAPSADTAKTRPRLPAKIARMLDDLNKAQRNLTRLKHQEHDLKGVLYRAWYHYLDCAYPGLVEPTVEADSVRALIERVHLPALKHLQDHVLRDGQCRRDKALFALEKALTAADHEMALTELPDDRFWRPRDPVVLLSGGVGQMSAAQARQENVAYRAQSIDDVPNVRTKPAKVNPRDWHPSQIEWQVGFHAWQGLSSAPPPLAKVPSDMLTRFTFLNDEPADLTAKSGSRVEHKPFVFSGRTTLSDHSVIMLRESIEGLLCHRLRDDGYFAKNGILEPDERRALYGDRQNIAHFYAMRVADRTIGEFEADFLTNLATEILPNLRDGMALSQSLGGFHDALLQERRAFELPPSDPLALGGYGEFAERVRAALDGKPGLSPDPLAPFMPLRAGAMGLLRLRVIDSFGQIHEQHEPQIKSAHSITMSGIDVSGPALDNGDPSQQRLVLPPRLSSPARLEFRLLSALDGTQTVNDDPASNPIHGWLALNYLDNAIAFYDARGRALWQVQEGEQRALPGFSLQPLDEGEDHPLHKIAEWMQVDWMSFSAILDMFERAEERIDPEGGYAQGDLALLAGRPIAVIRAKIALRFPGFPPAPSTWAQLEHSVRPERLRSTYKPGDPPVEELADTTGIGNLEVPLLLGDRRKLSDGLFGYWLEDPNDRDLTALRMPLDQNPPEDIEDQIHTYQPDMAFRSEVVPKLSASGEPLELLMLLDPAGAVHATTGILPVAKASIPPDFVAEALSRLTVSFQAGPMLGPLNAPPRVPLPKEAGYRWAWVERGDEGISDPAEPGKPAETAQMEGRVALRDGWLHLVPEKTKS